MRGAKALFPCPQAWGDGNRPANVLFVGEGTRSTYTYRGDDGLRRSAFEAGVLLPSGLGLASKGDEETGREGASMATVRYTVIAGEVIAEKRNGVRRLYVPDPLGSTVALLDNTQAKTDTFSYWPYGEEASRTGTTPTPLRFVGTQGYYRDGLTSIYVRARRFRPDLGQWMSDDPMGFRAGDANLHRYAGGAPVTYADPSGAQFGCAGPAPAPPQPRYPPIPRVPWEPGMPPWYKKPPKSCDPQDISANCFGQTTTLEDCMRCGEAWCFRCFGNLPMEPDPDSPGDMGPPRALTVCRHIVAQDCGEKPPSPPPPRPHPRPHPRPRPNPPRRRRRRRDGAGGEPIFGLG